MDEKLAQQILDELLEPIEDIETQSAAIRALLKAKGLATDEDLAPYLEQASKASSVRAVATRARISRLLSAATKPVEKPSEKSPETKPAQSDQPGEQDTPNSSNPTPEARDNRETAPTKDNDAKEAASSNQQTPDPAASAA
jgi:hypothetical protein